MVVDYRGVSRLQGLGPEVPLAGPGEHVVGHAAGLGHRAEAHVGRLGDDHVHQVAFELRRPGYLPARVHEVVAEPGPGVDLDQHRSEGYPGQHRGQLRAQHLGLRRDVFGGERRNDQLPIAGEADLAGGALGEQALQVNQGSVQLIGGLRQSVGRLKRFPTRWQNSRRCGAHASAVSRNDAGSA